MPLITLTRNLFNDLFFKIQETKNRILIIYGGSGAGKSYTICQHEIHKALTTPGIRIYFFSKTLPQAKLSTLPLLESILKKWQIYDQIKINRSDLSYTFPNGSVITLKDLFDPERLKGLIGDRIWFDEATNATTKDIAELMRRIRGTERKDPQIILSFNPISEDHWIKSTYVDKEAVNDHIKCIVVTYKDNKFLTAEDIESLERLKTENYEQYCIYVLAQWGVVKKGGEIYTHFKAERHISEVTYNDQLPLFLTFDENTQPYLTCLISQIEGNTVNVIDEICIRQAQLDVVLEEVNRRYYNHKSGIAILGDATSQKKNVFGESFYNIIYNTLKHFNPVLNLNSANPSVFMRTNWVNTEVFLREIIKVRINPNCVELIKDINNVKRGPDGGKEKKMITANSMRYQQYGHATDCLEYLLVTRFLSEYHTYKTGGTFKMIQKTRAGLMLPNRR